MKRTLTEHRSAFTAPAAALLLVTAGACKTVPHALDDLKSVHTVQGNTLEHRFEVERYGWFSGMILWGALSHVPFVPRDLTRETEKIDDPADFCVTNVKRLRNANFTDVTEAAEVVFWSGAITEADPFPLARVEGLRVLREVVYKYQPDAALLNTKEGDYLQGVLKRMQRLVKLQEISDGGQLTPELQEEYINITKELAVTPFTKASETRLVAQSLAKHCLAESNRDVRNALASASGVLLARGALQQMDRALGDSHERVRVAAARELIAALGPAVLGRIVTKLKEDSSADVRAALAAIVGDAARIGAPETEPMIDYLAAAARDPEPGVSVNAMEALGRLTGVGRQFDADWWRKWYEKRLLEKPADAGARGAKSAGN